MDYCWSADEEQDIFCRMDLVVKEFCRAKIPLECTSWFRDEQQIKVDSSRSSSTEINKKLIFRVTETI